jgi:hypothetical protein
VVDQENAGTLVPPREQEFATLRELLAALEFESDRDDEVADLIEEYADAYMDEDLGMNLFVNLGDGDEGEGMSLRAKLSFYPDHAVDMWVLDAPFTVRRFHRYLDELDLRVARLRAIVGLPPVVGGTGGDDEEQVPITIALATLFGADEADVLAQLGDNWVPIESDVMGSHSAPVRYLLWDDHLVVGLDDEYVHLFVPSLKNGDVEVGDVITSFELGDEETIGLAQFARALHEARADG